MSSQGDIEIRLRSQPAVNTNVTLDNFEVVPAPLNDALPDGAIRTETLFLSVDPYLRCRFSEDTGVDYTQPYVIGRPISSGGVGRVVESKREGFSPGDVVQALEWPWASTATFTADQFENASGLSAQPSKSIAPKEVAQLGLGLLGVPGLTAYFGVVGEGNIKEGTTFVVSAGAGATGIIAGQVARQLGASRVIGTCGSDAKADFLVNELGFTGAINYKKGMDHVRAELTRLAPSGIDTYFDNVGGEISDIIISQMTKGGTIVLCGQIATYNDTDTPYPPPLPAETTAIINEKEIKRERYLVLKYQEQFAQGIGELLAWYQAGKIKWKETVTAGLENAPQAFIDMMAGGNVGKAIVSRDA